MLQAQTPPAERAKVFEELARFARAACTALCAAARNHTEECARRRAGGYPSAARSRSFARGKYRVIVLRRGDHGRMLGRIRLNDRLALTRASAAAAGLGDEGRGSCVPRRESRARAIRCRPQRARPPA